MRPGSNESKASKALPLIALLFTVIALIVLQRMNYFNSTFKIIAELILVSATASFVAMTIFKNGVRKSKKENTITRAALASMSITGAQENVFSRDLSKYRQTLFESYLSRNKDKIIEIRQELQTLRRQLIKTYGEAESKKTNPSLMARWLYNQAIPVESLLQGFNPPRRLILGWVQNIRSGKFAETMQRIFGSDEKLPTLLQDYSIPQLVIAYNSVTASAARRAQLHIIILGIIENFANKKVWETNLIDTIIPLAVCNNPIIARSLLEVCLRRLDKSILANTDLIIGIGKLIRYANHRTDRDNFKRVLTGDDLLQVLLVITKQLEKWEMSAVNEENLLALLRPLSELLNAMVEQNVQLSEEKTRSLTKSLRSFITGKADYEIIFYAAYAYQALLRLPDESNPLSKYLGCGYKFVKGAISIASSAWQMDPFALVESVAELREGIDDVVSATQSTRRQPWYNTLRVVETCIPSNRREIARLHKLLASNKLAHDAVLAYGVIVKLLPLLTSEYTQLRLQTYRWLRFLTGVNASLSLELNSGSSRVKKLLQFSRSQPADHTEHWPADARVQQHVLHAVQSQAIQHRITQSIQFLRVSAEKASEVCLEKRYWDRLTSDLRVAVHKNIRTEKQTLIENTAVQSLVEHSVDSSHAPTTHSPKPLAKELIIQAYYKSFPIEYRIEQMWLQVQQELNSREIARELACYVPLKAVGSLTDLENVKALRFDLQEKVLSVLEGGEKLLLIHGDSGSGKSIFGRYFLREHLKNSISGKVVPLYIHLGQMTDPTERLVEKALAQLGFTEPELQALKTRCQNGERDLILYLDGFDEMNNYQNLYIRNKLRDWNARVVITCRLGQLPGNYKSLFTIDANYTLPEYYIAPFNQQQIDDYIILMLRAKYSAIKNEAEKQKKIELEFQESKSILASLPSIAQLIQCPFFLNLVLGILSDLKKKQHSGSGLAITRADVYEAFLESWYTREELVVRAERGASLPKGFGLRESFKNFGEDLAWAMLKRNQTVIPVEPNVFRTVEETSENPWEGYFTETNVRTAAARAGVPLKRTGNNVEFIHRSVGHYYIACRLKKELEDLRDGKKQLNASIYFNQVELTGKIPVFEFLQDLIQHDHGFKEVVFKMMRHSNGHADCVKLSSNAASFIAYVGWPISGEQFDGVILEGSHLLGLTSDHTRWHGARLRRVKLSRGWIRGAIFDDAELDVDFSERPCLEHEEIIRQVRFAPNDNQLAVSAGPSVYLWDAEKQEPQGKLEGGHSADITCMDYSHDGRLLVSGSNDNKLCLWNLHTKIVQRHFEGHKGRITCVAFHPKQNRFLAGSRDSAIVLWDVETGKSLQTFSGHRGSITALAFDSSGETFISSSHLDSDVRLWKKDSHDPTLLSGHKGGVYAIAFHPAATFVVTGGEEKAVILWDLATSERHRLNGPNDWIMCTGFSRDGESVVAGCWDNMVYVWEVKTKSLQRVYSSHTLPVLSLSVNFKNDLVASAGGDGKVQLWDAKSNEFQRQETGHTNAVRFVAVRLQGGLVASASIDKTVRLWDPETGKLIRVFKDHTKEVRGAAFSKDGATLATVSNDQTLRFWDLITFQLRRTIEKAHEKDIICVVYSPDGKMVATSSWDNTIRLWTNTGDSLRILQGHPAGIFSIAFSPDGKILISGHQDQMVVVWNVETGEIKARYKEHTLAVRGVAFCPNTHGEIFATASYDKSIKLWSIKIGKSIRTYKVAEPELPEAFECVVFSPDGSMIAAGGSCTVRIWETETGKVVTVLRGFQTQVNSLAWDKSSLFAGSANNTVTCWRPAEVSPDKVVWLLMWTTHAKSLVAEGCQLKGTTGLTPLNAKLLAERGAEISTEHFARNILQKKVPEVQVQAGSSGILIPTATEVSRSHSVDEIILASAKIYMMLEGKRISVNIETARLRLESVSPLNYVDFIKLLGSRDNMRAFADGESLPADKVKLRIKLWAADRWQNMDPFSAFAVYTRNPDVFIGYVALGYSLKEPDKAEIVYVFDKPFWGMGYGKEAVISILRKYAPKLMVDKYKLKDKDFNGVVAITREDNDASQKILKKGGMTVTGQEYSFGANRFIFLAKKEELMQGFVDDVVTSTLTSNSQSNK